MKKKISNVLFVLAGVLAAAFIGMIIWDACAHYQFGSSPFYVYVLVRGLEFLLPAVISAVIAIILRKKK